MKKSLLATLADENYISRARQLFSSVYFNAGWKGDYLLLSHNIPEEKLKWFKDRGILVYECRPLAGEKIYGDNLSLMLDKAYLFKEFFKKWQNIIYLDGDIIVKGPLDGLLGKKGFCAVRDSRDFFIKNQLISEDKIESEEIKKLYGEIKNRYSPDSAVFNAGFFSFNTDLIAEKTFEDFVSLAGRYKNISANGDQAIFNFFFYKNWEALPCAYNLPPYLVTHPVIFTDTKIKTIILHFVGERKPWQENDHFYGQWKNNLDRADEIDFRKPAKKAESWDGNKIEKYSRSLEIKKALYAPIYSLDRLAGLSAKFARKIFIRKA